MVAVVSLPAGVFKPYSGVKTSVLLLDKSLAKRTDRIGFFKVENDGFDLGAQRREVDRNDLPETAQGVKEYMNMDAQDRQDKEESCSSMLRSFIERGAALIVEKERIAANGDYNLSGERYRENGIRTSHFPIVPLGKVAEVIAGQSPAGKSYNDTGIGAPFYQGKTEFGQLWIGEPTKWTTDPQRFAQEGDILMSVRAPVGPVNLATERICIGRGLSAIRPETNQLLTAYAFYVLRSLEGEITGNTGAAFASINKDDIKKLKIPLPPPEVQKEIVAEIEGYQKIIDGARAVIDNYRPHIPIDPDWPMVAIKEVASVESGFGFPTAYQGKSEEKIPFLKVSDMNLPGNEVRIVSWNNAISSGVLRELKAKTFPAGTVIFPKIGAAIATNKKRLLTRDSTYDNNVMGVVPNSKLLPDFLHTWLLAFDLSRWAERCTAALYAEDGGRGTQDSPPAP